MFGGFGGELAGLGGGGGCQLLKKERDSSCSITKGCTSLHVIKGKKEMLRVGRSSTTTKGDCCAVSAWVRKPAHRQWAKLQRKGSSV